MSRTSPNALEAVRDLLKQSEEQGVPIANARMDWSGLLPAAQTLHEQTGMTAAQVADKFVEMGLVEADMREKCRERLVVAFRRGDKRKEARFSTFLLEEVIPRLKDEGITTKLMDHMKAVRLA